MQEGDDHNRLSPDAPDLLWPIVYDRKRIFTLNMYDWDIDKDSQLWKPWSTQQPFSCIMTVFVFSFAIVIRVHNHTSVHTFKHDQFNVFFFTIEGSSWVLANWRIVGKILTAAKKVAQPLRHVSTWSSSPHSLQALIVAYIMLQIPFSKQIPKYCMILLSHSDSWQAILQVRHDVSSLSPVTLLITCPMKHILITRIGVPVLDFNADAEIYFFVSVSQMDIQSTWWEMDQCKD